MSEEFYIDVDTLTRNIASGYSTRIKINSPSLMARMLNLDRSDTGYRYIIGKEYRGPIENIGVFYKAVKERPEGDLISGVDASVPREDIRASDLVRDYRLPRINEGEGIKARRNSRRRRNAKNRKNSRRNRKNSRRNRK